ncbi:MAG: immunoglobulin domain-containing protein [Deltaproteobacteria bacterium]
MKAISLPGFGLSKSLPKSFKNFFLFNLITLLSLIHGYSQEPGLTFVKQLGGTGLNIGRSVTIDTWGNIYSAGYFDGIMDMNPGPQCYFLTSNGGKDIYISKLDASGNFCWAVSIGGCGDDLGLAIDWNQNGSLSLTGSFQGTVDFNPGNGCNFLTSNGCNDVFILNLSTSGIFCWAKNIGGCSNDIGKTIKSDPWGNIYVGGGFCASTDFNPGPGCFTMSSDGFQDGFILKLDPTGNFCWANKIGSYWDDCANGITVDNSGFISITGNYAGSICIPSIYGNIYLPEFGSYEIFVAKLNSSGNFIWAKGAGGCSEDIAQSIHADNMGNLLITGSFSGSSDFDPGSAIYNLTSSGLTDIFIMKLNANGQFCWAKKFGGAGNDVGMSVVTDISGNVYSTGYFENYCVFNPGSACFNSCGSQDIFILKLDCNGLFNWAKQFGGISQDVGYSIDLDNNNNIISTGFFKNTVDFDPGPGSFQLTSAGNTDAYVMKLGFCNPCTPVSITCHPQSQVASAGSQAVFSVTVSGTPPFNYQWKKNGCNIPGANNSIYITPVLDFSDNGSTYSCVISNCNGSYYACSNIALLTIINTCFTPTVQASCITFTNVMPTQMTLNWINGNGTGRIVVAKAACNIFGSPCDNINYNANSAFGCGSTIAPGEFVVYNGSGSSVTVTNLAPNTTYYFRVFEFSCNIPRYLLCPGYGNPSCKKTGGSCPPPGIQAYYIHFSSISVQEMTVHWNNGSGTGRIVVAKAWSDISGAPVNGVNYTGNNKFGYGSMLGPGEYVVYNGTGDFVCVKNLASSTKYYFKVFEYCCDPPQYICSGAFGNSNWEETGTYCFGPTVQASELTFTDIWPNQMKLNWINGNGEKRLVVAKCGSEVKGTPQNGLTYLPNSCFGLGSTIADGEFIIYNGTGNSATVTGLIPGSIYHFKVLEYNCYKEQYLNSNTSGNPAYQITPSSCSPPNIQASDISFSDQTDSKVTVKWKNGNGTRRIVVCKMYEPVTKTPVNGKEYQGNSIFKCGDYIGPGEYVVYNGNGNSVTVTNLIKGKTYFFRIFEYTCYPPSYLTSSASGNPNGLTLGITFPTINSVIANNVIKNQVSLPETFKFYDNQTPYISNNPVKVCADGSSSTFFRLNISDSEGIGMEITDNNGIKVADDKSSLDFSKYGSIGKPVKIENKIIEIPYTHPQFMDLPDKLYRELILKITFNGIPVYGINIPLHIYRAPTLIVQGLWSDGTENFHSEIIKSKTQTSDLIYQADYSENSPESFSENSLVVPEGIMGLLIKARNKKFSAGKVDVIGTGTGGTLSRYYLQDLGDIKYRNDINKLITINSPHNGTQAANLLLNSNAAATQNLLNILGYNTGGGAIADLRAGSIANSSLNSTILKHHSVPLYTMNSSKDYSILNSQSSEWDRLIFYYTYWNNPSFYNNFGINDPESLANYVFFNEKGDLFIPASSQKGGIPLTNEIPFNSAHTEFESNNSIISFVNSKLSENPNDPAKFWKNGFGSLVPLPVRTFVIEPDDNSLPASITDSVRILAPVNNANYYSGDSILVKCKATTGISSIFMVAGANQKILKFIQTNNDSISTYIHIPPDFTGKTVIYCAGRNNNSFLDDETIYINIIPKAVLDSIEIRPENLIVGTGSLKAFNLYGYYNDGIKRKISGLTGINNDITDKNIAEISENFRVFGKKSGQTLLKSEYLGKKDSIDIFVYFSEIQGKSDFEVNSNSVCEKGVLRFNSTSTGKPDSIKWIFEGGIPSESVLSEQYVVYENPGVYNVALIAFYKNKKDTLLINDYINVNPSPAAFITAEGTNSFCEGETLTLSSSEAAVYLWNNGAKTRSIDVMSSGAYFVNITNENGCSGISDTMTVVFSPHVTPEVSITSSAENICSGDEVIFTAVPIHGGNNPHYQWFINGIEQPIDSSVLSSSEISKNSVINCILTSDAACTKQTTAISNYLSVNVNPKILPAVLINANKISACEGETINLEAILQNGGDNPQFKWFIDGQLQTETTGKFSSSQIKDGAKVYCEITSDAFCLIDTTAVSDTLSFTIDTLKTPDISIISSETLICSGDSVIFTALPVNQGNNPVYQWFVNGIQQGSNSSTFVASNIKDGEQVFCMLISNASCLTKPTAISNFIKISVNTKLTPSVSISASATTVYSCDLVTFTATPVNGGDLPEIRWYVNGNFAAYGPKFSNAALQNGSNIYCTLSTDLPCATSDTATSEIVTITVIPLPQPIIKLIHDTIYSTNYRDTKYSYTWYFKGSRIASTPYLLCSEYGNGTYYLVVEYGNCSVTSNTVDINCTVGTGDTEMNYNIIAYPNPVKKILTLEGETENEKALALKFYNLLGIEVMHYKLNVINNKFKAQFDLQNLPQGIYFISIKSENYNKIIQFEKIE